MDTYFYPFITSVPEYNHYSKNNLLLCIDTNGVMHEIYCLPKTSYSYGTGKWLVTYHEHYKFLTENNYGVDFFLFVFGK